MCALLRGWHMQNLLSRLVEKSYNVSCVVCLTLMEWFAEQCENWKFCYEKFLRRTAEKKRQFVIRQKAKEKVLFFSRASRGTVAAQQARSSFIVITKWLH